jgi:dethiobiotin synthetase
MNVSNIASMASSMAAAKTREEADVAVLKKAMDMQKTNAAALLAALPQPAAPNLPAHLGRNVNTTA